MEPISIILTGLATGAATGFGDVAANSIKDLYARLRTAVSDKLSGPRAQQALTRYEEDPAAHAEDLERELREHGVADDPRIVELAQTLARLIGEAGTPTTNVYLMNDARGIQFGEKSTQNLYFN